MTIHLGRRFRDGSSGLPGPHAGYGSRKVRTPKGRTLGKTQAAKADGKWHRKETAIGELLSGDAEGKGETVE